MTYSVLIIQLCIHPMSLQKKINFQETFLKLWCLHKRVHVIYVPGPMFKFMSIIRVVPLLRAFQLNKIQCTTLLNLTSNTSIQTNGCLKWFRKIFLDMHLFCLVYVIIFLLEWLSKGFFMIKFWSSNCIRSFLFLKYLSSTRKPVVCKLLIVEVVKVVDLNIFIICYFLAILPASTYRQQILVIFYWSHLW